MAAHPIIKSFNQVRQWSSIGFRKRHYAATLQMFDEPLRPSQSAAIAAVKGMRATACGQVIGKGVEDDLIELFDSNLFNRGPFSQVCCTAQDQLRGPALESSGLEPVRKRIHVVTCCTLPQLAQPVPAFNVKLQHGNLLGC